MGSPSGSPVIRCNRLHPTLRPCILPCSNDSLLHHFLPIFFLLLFSFSTFTVAYAQHPQFDGFDPQAPPQQCGSFTFTWSGGAPPYIFTIRETNYTLLRDPFDEDGFENRTYTWNPVDVQGGTELFAEVKDSGGQRAFTRNFTIGSSSDGGCLGLESSPSSTASSTLSSDGASTALSIPTTPSSSVPTPADSSTSLSSSSKSAERLSAGAISGIVVGLVILVLLVVGAFVYLRRRRRANGRVAAGILGGAKYRAARSSLGPLSKATEQPVTFWDANLFVREKAATTQVRDSLLSPLVARPDLCVSAAVPSLHSKGDDELVSLVDPLSDSDSDLDMSEVTGTHPSTRHLSPSLDPLYSLSASPANTSPGHLLDGTRPRSATGGDAGSRSDALRP